MHFACVPLEALIFPNSNEKMFFCIVSFLTILFFQIWVIESSIRLFSAFDFGRSHPFKVTLLRFVEWPPARLFDFRLLDRPRESFLLARSAIFHLSPTQCFERGSLLTNCFLILSSLQIVARHTEPIFHSEHVRCHHPTIAHPIPSYPIPFFFRTRRRALRLGLSIIITCSDRIPVLKSFRTCGRPLLFPSFFIYINPIVSFFFFYFFILFALLTISLQSAFKSIGFVPISHFLLFLVSYSADFESEQMMPALKRIQTLTRPFFLSFLSFFFPSFFSFFLLSFLYYFRWNTSECVSLPFVSFTEKKTQLSICRSLAQPAHSFLPNISMHFGFVSLQPLPVRVKPQTLSLSTVFSRDSHVLASSDICQSFHFELCSSFCNFGNFPGHPSAWFWFFSNASTNGMFVRCKTNIFDDHKTIKSLEN